MLKIRDYRDYWNKFIDLVPELDDIILVHSEGELSRRIQALRNKKYILSVVMPSADIRAGDADSLAYWYDAILFILVPAAKSVENEDKFIDAFDKTGDIAQLILETLNNDCASGQCHLFNDLDFGSIKIDPEVNFMGTNGYSISFNFKYPF